MRFGGLGGLPARAIPSGLRSGGCSLGVGRSGLPLVDLIFSPEGLLAQLVFQGRRGRRGFSTQTPEDPADRQAQQQSNDQGHHALDRIHPASDPKPKGQTQRLFGSLCDLFRKWVVNGCPVRRGGSVLENRGESNPARSGDSAGSLLDLASAMA